MARPHDARLHAGWTDRNNADRESPTLEMLAFRGAGSSGSTTSASSSIGSASVGGPCFYSRLQWIYPSFAKLYLERHDSCGHSRPEAIGVLMRGPTDGSDRLRPKSVLIGRASC